MDYEGPPNRRATRASGDARLESWKEIAAYFSRDVTTVRRWEKREGLPVHRLHHSKLSSVYAYTSELDAWRSRRGKGRGAAEARLPRLAVLPLENLSSDPEQEYFADGITEALLTQLSGLHGLRVISRTSVLPFKRAVHGRSRDRQVSCGGRGYRRHGY